MKRFLRPSLCTLLIWATSAALADPVTFEQANKLYEEGRFLEAIQAYQELMTNSPSPAVHYNLGNAWFKSGQIGEAIAEYRRAEALSPRDPDIRANLKFARDRVNGPSSRPGWLEQKAATFSTGEWAAATTMAIWVFFSLLVAGQFRPAWRAGLGPWNRLAGAGATLLLTSTIWTWHSRANTHIAVIVPRETVMRRGPFEESQSASTLGMGTEVRVLDEKGGWLQVTPDGQYLGWITNAAARNVR